MSAEISINNATEITRTTFQRGDGGTNWIALTVQCSDGSYTEISIIAKDVAAFNKMNQQLNLQKLK